MQWLPFIGAFVGALLGAVFVGICIVVWDWLVRRKEEKHTYGLWRGRCWSEIWKSTLSNTLQSYPRMEHLRCPKWGRN